MIPKSIRRGAGVTAGMPLDVRCENGKIVLTPLTLPFNLERRGRLLVAIPAGNDVAPVLGNIVEHACKQLFQLRAFGSW